MAVQGWMFNQKDQNVDNEAARLLSYRTLGTRMSQVDDILKRKTEAALFALDEEENGKHESTEELDAVKEQQRKEKIVKELLKKVKKRRKLVRSYSYFTWFCAFFACFLANLYIKAQLNEHLFSVDESIKNRIVDILPVGNIGSNLQFYDWMVQVVADVFADSVCGNGVCEPPLEYPSVGRFGCAADCGLYPQRTSLRIDVQSAWSAGLPTMPGLDFSGFNVSHSGEPAIKFAYNIYSETMGDYMLATDATQPSITLDVPDGNLRLELYQVGMVSTDTPAKYLASYAGVAPGTMPAARKRFDFQYGDPAEAVASVATLNRKLQVYCTSVPTDPSAQCNGLYNPVAAATSLFNMYGLSGNVSMIGSGNQRQNLVTFPFCSLTPPAVASAARIDSAQCFGAVPGLNCYNASVLAQTFSCTGQYGFSIWSFGPPRNVSVKPPPSPSIRTLTPFNNVIGGIIVTQYVRKTVSCPYQNSDSISTLTGKFSCQTVDKADMPFGIDPVFVSSSQLYNGKLSPQNYYSNQEFIPGSNHPYGFFPHQWNTGQQDNSFLSAESIGQFKLFFDARLSADKARILVQFMKDGMFLSNKTDWIEMEIITYNADFNLFGILTVQFRWNLGGSTLWSYQYNTALLSPYEGIKGLISITFDVIFGTMLLVDVIRECRDIYNCILRENLLNGYILKFWNWVEWAHFGLLSSGFFFWAVYNQYISAIEFKSDYPVLQSLNAPARMFATEPSSEFDLLDFTIKMRKLSELKNFWTALSCVNILLFVMRFLKVLDFQPRMSLITRTLRLASVDLGHYLTLFSIILIGYATIGTVLLGERLKQFQTFGDACAALFMILMAWEPQTMYTAMSSATNQAKIGATIVSFQVFFWSWVLIATFIMLNIVLAIIVEAFSHIKASLKEAPTITAESLSVWRQTMRMMVNRILGREWLISDKELEKVLIAHDRSFQSRKNFLKSVGQIRGTIKSRCVRIPGGLQVSDRDLETLLQGHACTGRRSVLANAKRFFRKEKAPRPRTSSSRRLSMTSFMSTHEDGIEIAVDHAYCPPVPVADLMNRYGEVVIDGQDDEEMLRLLQTENIKREMALYATQDKIREHVETVVETLDSMIDFVLPTDEIKKLKQGRVEARNQEAKLGNTKDLKSKSNYIFDGTLKLIVVSAKRLPKLDLFSESDPYCVLILEEKTAHKGSDQTVLAATETRMNDPNPIWNSEHQFPIQCTADTALVAAVMDRDEVGSDEMIGMVRISMSDLPINEEMDRWYRLRNDASPNLTKRALVRLKICLVPSSSDDAAAEESKNTGRRNSLNDQTSLLRCRSTEIENELVWLKERLSSNEIGTKEKCKGLLEITLVSARHLPKRGKIFTKLSLCDPYMKISYRDIEFASIVRKNTYSPEWGQSFAFDLDDLSEVGPLRVTVMDWNKYSQHELIGTVDISEQQIQHILFETFADWNQQHTFPILKNGLSILGHDGNLAQLTLTFRCTARKTGTNIKFQGSFDAIPDPVPETEVSEPVVTCDWVGCNDRIDLDAVCGSNASSASQSRHDADGIGNPSVTATVVDTGMELEDEEFSQPTKPQLKNGTSLADRYRMASKIVSSVGVARPRDFRLSLPIVETQRCLPATLVEDSADVEVSMPEWNGNQPGRRTGRLRAARRRPIATPSGRPPRAEEADC